MESKQPVTIVERIQHSYREDPQPFWVLTASTIIDRLGTNLIIPTSQALTALLTPLDMQARYVATEHFNWIIAQALSPLAAGTIMDRLDSRWVWYGCSLICAISILGFYGLHLHARDRLMDNQPNCVSGGQERS